MKGTRVDNMVDHDVNIVHAVSVDDFEGCVIENSESPCSSGGLHMPDSRSLHNFVKEIRRIRHHSQCHSESGVYQYSPILKIMLIPSIWVSSFCLPYVHIM